ncbi:hypothetical protein AnigIFM50267_003503 [Aspergillus niger]|nr:hypothetical protein AnigIFM50267_003503 [Aspergillus niger]
MPEGGDTVEGGEEDRLEGGKGETDEATVEIANVVKNQRLELPLPLPRPRQLLLALGKHGWTVLELPRQRRVRRCCMLWALKTLLVAEVKVGPPPLRKRDKVDMLPVSSWQNVPANNSKPS